jgi:hypothetical protein
VICAPGIDIVALAPGTLEQAILPPEGVDVGLTLFGTEELVDVCKDQHGCISPGGLRLAGDREEILTYHARFTLLQTPIN